MVGLPEWITPTPALQCRSDRSERLLSLYIQSLFVDERAGIGADRHRVSAGVFRLMLDALGEECSEGTDVST